MSVKRENVIERSPSRKPSFLENIKPFTRLHGGDQTTSSVEKLPLIKSPTGPTQSNFFRNSLRKSSRPGSIEELKKEDPSPNKPQQLTPRSSCSSLNNINAVTRVAFKSRVGSVRARPKVHNQDSFIIKPSLKGIKGHYMFAVCDGHGTYGHDVSQYVRDFFPGFLEECLDKDLSPLTIEKSFYQAVTKLNKGLIETGIEIAFSGTTMNCLVLFGSLCACANVGDSRSVLGRNLRGRWEAISLSEDHNTKRSDERTRILSSKGRIGQAVDEDGNFNGPERVWLIDEDIPGLAMTRSIGDKISKIVGVTSDPEVVIRRLNSDDKFIIIASDGVWEHVNSDEAVQIVCSYYQDNRFEDAAVALACEAAKRWDKNEYVDDITVVVIFLSI
ncbi:hypothetical protein SteCoe_14778 [Stentor coeruleus]|uniref:PPM-type phosphatase domain-containing protein n=1 Tax=Stentor coeruleus TaxID=5963 RepID=A0A1R2C558_9CILI|nr:hypothetical protein SteCoe_14778 [Stentor coeruleus]